MADIGLEKDQVQSYNTQGVLKAGDDVYRLVQSMGFTLDDRNQFVRRTDGGRPIYTRVGDVRGEFDFDLASSVDLFESRATPTNANLASLWMRKIFDDDYPEIVFTQTLFAEDSTGDKFVRLGFTGRIKHVDTGKVDGEGNPLFTVSGEVIGFTGARRAAS